MDDPSVPRTRKRTRLTIRGQVALAVLLALATFALGVAVGGAMRRNPGTPHLLTGSADVRIVTVTETAP